jgi:IMP dehydrogenase
MLRVIEEAFTFDDVLLLPAHSQVLPRDVSLATRLTRRLNLSIPIVSAAMDTVTGGRLAIAIAQEGGIGIIHKNFSIEEQAREVRMVKKYESGVIKDPITITAHTSIGDLIELTKIHNISGMPVLDHSGDLVGIVTARDLRFETHHDAPVSSIMTPREKLVTVKEGASADEIRDLLHRHRIEKILVVNDAFELRGMVTVKDIYKAQLFPNACKDELSRLRVGAAVGTGPDTDERVRALVAEGVDVVVVDTAHGHHQGVIDMVARIKGLYPDLQVIGGNIATAAAAPHLAEAGADAVKVGIGPGSICTTRIVTGVGVPQITAVANVAEQLKGSGVPLIADGGIRFSGDVAKAIAAGAHCVMIGSMFAGTEEAPGEVELYQGRSYKILPRHGLAGRDGQRQGSSDRYFPGLRRKPSTKLVPEGIEGRVPPTRGRSARVLHQLAGGLRAAMGYTGSGTIDEMRTGRSSCASPMPGSARATCTTSPSPRKRRTTASR